MTSPIAHATPPPATDAATPDACTPAAAATQGAGARVARKTPPWLAALLLVATIAYPAVVYLALGHVGPRWIAVLLVVLALARAAVTREAFWFGAAGLAGVLAAASFLGDRWGPLKLYPALINFVMFALFAGSLWRGPSVAERLARLRETDFPPAAIAYTRRVTQVWCGFFIVNGGLAVATALWASAATWALYNGLVAYVAMGALMGAEWLVRRRVRRRIAARQATTAAALAPDGALHG